MREICQLCSLVMILVMMLPSQSRYNQVGACGARTSAASASTVKAFDAVTQGGGPMRKPRTHHPQYETSIVATLEAVRGHISEFAAALGRTRAFVALIVAMGLLALHYSPQPTEPIIHLAAVAALITTALFVALIGRDDDEGSAGACKENPPARKAQASRPQTQAG
jgi:hypothetical protein